MNARNVQDHATLDDIDWKEQYNDRLDEVCGDVHIGKLTYKASECLEAVDLVAYELGFEDYLDNLSEPWQCGECGERYEDEQSAEECCNEEGKQ